VRPKERPTRFGRARDLASTLLAAGRPHSSSGNSDASCSSDGNQSAGYMQVRTWLDRCAILSGSAREIVRWFLLVFSVPVGFG
jgi:hypothetical protein